MRKRSKEQRKTLSHESVEAGTASWRSISINVGSYYSLGYKVGTHKRGQTHGWQKWGSLGRSHASAFRFHHLPFSCALHKDGGKPVLLVIRRSVKPCPSTYLPHHEFPPWHRTLLPSHWLSLDAFADIKTSYSFHFATTRRSESTVLRQQ